MRYKLFATLLTSAILASTAAFAASSSEDRDSNNIVPMVLKVLNKDIKGAFPVVTPDTPDARKIPLRDVEIVESIPEEKGIPIRTTEEYGKPLCYKLSGRLPKVLRDQFRISLRLT